MNTFTFPNNCFSALIQKRNQVKDQFGIWMKFPKGNEFKHGNCQTMILVGYSNIEETRNYLDNIIKKTLDFKKRNKEKRKKTINIPIYQEEKKQELTSRINMFSALEMSESEGEEIQEEIRESEVDEIKEISCWGDMV